MMVDNHAFHIFNEVYKLLHGFAQWITYEIGHFYYMNEQDGYSIFYKYFWKQYLNK